jgi:GntR family negative regulator for fad regulon and positive regulator of fabA
MKWETPQKPAEIAESRLIKAILDDDFPVESTLPAERELALNLGVTRPTLREALQRMARDGWVEIQQGKSTRVKDFWRDGNLGVLSSIAQYPNHLPEDFVLNILQVRQLLAPAYTQLAFERSPDSVGNFFNFHPLLDDTPIEFAVTDYELHRHLTITSGNPIFTLILNGFSKLYIDVALKYFTVPNHREHSRNYYNSLLKLAKDQKSLEAAQLTEQVMSESIELWQTVAEMEGEI